MNRMTQEGRAKLEELIARVMKDGQARGIAVGIVNAAGEIQYENYFGYRDAENKLPITRDTIFGMASVTKSFTALSIMQMQQDGLLKVDDPVSRYIPEFTNKNQSEPVKLWHLMCHSGGYFPLPRIVVDKTAQEIAALVKTHRPERIVMGFPRNMDGSEGPRADLYREFAALLEELLGQPVVLWDERRTTIEAHQILSDGGYHGKKRKNTVDAVAASLILEGYLNYLNSHKE